MFQAFSCYSFDSGEHVLKADLGIDCDASNRPAIVTYAVVMVFVYPIGITLMYAILLWRQRKAICPIKEKWRDFLCFKEVFPPQLRTMDEEDKITQQRKLDIELNPNLKSIQFLFKVGGIVFGIACCLALRQPPYFLFVQGVRAVLLVVRDFRMHAASHADWRISDFYGGNCQPGGWWEPDLFGIVGC